MQYKRNAPTGCYWEVFHVYRCTSAMERNTCQTVFGMKPPLSSRWECPCVLTSVLCSSAAAELQRVHPGHAEVAAEKSLQLLHAALLSLLRYTQSRRPSCAGCNSRRHLSLHLLLTGSDLLKLTRDDLVQICGPADGIRLFNALKSRCVVCVWSSCCFPPVRGSFRRPVSLCADQYVPG